MFVNHRLTILFFGLTTSFILLSFADLLYDLFQTGFQLLELLEFILILAVSSCTALLWLQLWKNLKKERSTVLKMQASLQSFRNKHDSSLASMKLAIDDQFKEWGLSRTEQQIARLLVLGHSFKRISDFTKKSPKTIQNHATSIYHKSMTLGRSDLAAYFLCDIFED